MSIVEIAKETTRIIEESKNTFNRLHLQEIKVSNYVSSLLTKDIKGRYIIQDPSSYGKKNKIIANSLYVYMNKKNDNGKQMDGFMDDMGNIIDEGDFKKEVKKFYTKNRNAELDEILIDNAVDDLLKKLHTLQNGGSID